jgi:hypothetical protein
MKIDDNAFNGCSSLEQLNTPENLMVIGQKAFYKCKKLLQFDIPAGIVSIGHNAFQGCSSIKAVLLPAELDWSRLEQHEFDGCENMEEVTLPEALTTVTYYAFRNCAKLKKVVFPANISDIYGDEIFAGCTSLETVVLPKALKSWDGSLGGFYDCSSLQSLYTYDANPADLTWVTFSGKFNFNATLYVPKGCIDIYKTKTGWKDFKNIKEFDAESESEPTGITNIKSDLNSDKTIMYDLNGRRVSESYKGVVLIKKGNDPVRKALLK